MAEDRERNAWGHTSSILAQLDNCQAFRSSRPAARPERYNPFHDAADSEAAAEVDPTLFIRAFAAAVGCQAPEEWIPHG